MNVQIATDAASWESFVKRQRFAPFLQSWTMGEVYRDIGQEPLRFEVRHDGRVVGTCQAIVVPARRGRHLMVQYGPVLGDELRNEDRSIAWQSFIDALSDVAIDHRCAFLRISPFFPLHPLTPLHLLTRQKILPSPLHLLSEYTWYIPLKNRDRWSDHPTNSSPDARSEESIKADMRKTTRNLVGRAEREGVTVEASKNPNTDLDIYFKLQEETYKRHGFVPYRESFIRAQVKHFSANGQAIVYVANYQNEPVAASVHMSYGGITSYHHGASTHKYAKIPASYLLQWTAIHDALVRGDDIYNFWGIAPRKVNEAGEEVIINPKHPFAGVTTFKTGFGGHPLPLLHCMDVPLSATYTLTRAFENVRKWKRGF
jgi:lipid II:glycine glycyltransferase (peptidoglycan interpeptide bridge formation enzyme)